MRPSDVLVSGESQLYWPVHSGHLQHTSGWLRIGPGGGSHPHSSERTGRKLRTALATAVGAAARFELRAWQVEVSVAFEDQLGQWLIVKRRAPAEAIKRCVTVGAVAT